MSDDKASNLRALADRGARAERILKDPLFVEAFDAVDAQIVALWRGRENDLETRERSYLMQRLLPRLREHLESHMKTGELASGQLARLEEERTRLQKLRQRVRRGQ